MNVKKWSVVAVLGFVGLAFYLAVSAYQQSVQTAQDQQIAEQQARLVRAHSPVMGAPEARVTIVEFFDPACETCRAFYPFVKQLMAQYPNDVRLVIRYAPFHQDSDVVVKLLEAAKIQGKYQQVLEALLAAQPAWADHHQPNLSAAFEVAQLVGLDMQRAEQDMKDPSMQALLQQDLEDLTALQVSKTPTFFVNGRSLPSFGSDQLAALLAEEVAKLSSQ